MRDFTALIQRRGVVLVHPLDLALIVNPQHNERIGPERFARRPPSQQLSHHGPVIHASDHDLHLALPRNNVDGRNVRPKVFDGRHPAPPELGHALVSAVLHEKRVVVPSHPARKLRQKSRHVGAGPAAPAVHKSGGDLLVLLVIRGHG